MSDLNPIVLGAAYSHDFPPSNDHPIVVLSDGTVISRYGDVEWKFPLGSGAMVKVHFGADPKKKLRLNAQNGSRMREILYYFYAKGSRPIRPTTLRHYFNCITRIFKLCSDNGVLVEDLHRFPKLIERVSSYCLPSKKIDTRNLLLEIYKYRGDLGFYIVTPDNIALAFPSEPPLEVNQTPYVPGRLWVYQVSRLQEALLDFSSRKKEIREVFEKMRCLYISTFGVEHAFEVKVRAKSKSLDRFNTVAANLFSETGLDRLFDKWVFGNEAGFDGSSLGARVFSKYLSAMVFIGNIYIANFSGLRRQELRTLRSSSLRIEEDDVFGSIYLIEGRTTKTISDDHALWVTSEKVRLAFDVLKLIAELRVSVAILNPKLSLSPRDIADPYLAMVDYEPWGRGCRSYIAERPVLLMDFDYARWVERCPGLFDIDELVLSDDDAREAHLATEFSSKSRIRRGQSWKFSLHQLRRTLAVNAACSGLVSNRSLQYELKHLTPQMSFYYGRNSSRFTFDERIVNEFRNEVFDGIAREAISLRGDRFVSPLGETNKEVLISFIEERDHRKLVSLAERGGIALRQTMAGLCLSTEFCQFGGIDNIEECGSCSKALFDKNKRFLLVSLLDKLQDQSLALKKPSPLKESLDRQMQFLERILYAIQ